MGEDLGGVVLLTVLGSQGFKENFWTGDMVGGGGRI